MFEGREFPKSLDEEVFDLWLENGRLSKMGYKYLLIIWDEYQAAYQPVYTDHRDDIRKYDNSSISRERLVAAYDLYSESRIS
jgi:hypothetical protein